MEKTRATPVYENNINSAPTDLYVKSIGGRRGRPDQQIDHFDDSVNTLLFALSGRAWLRLGRREFLLSERSMFFLPAGEELLLTPEDAPLDYVWVTFGGELAPRYAEYIGFTEEPEPRRFHIPPPELRQLVALIRQPIWPDGPAQSLWQTGRLYELFSRLVEGAAAQNAPAYDYSPRVYVTHAREYIEVNYATATIEEVADFTGLGRAALNSMFNKVLGMSTRDYLMEYRMERAKALLRETRLPVAEVARRVGYRDQLAFSKIFKQKNGLSPTDYRREEDANAG